MITYGNRRMVGLLSLAKSFLFAVNISRKQTTLNYSLLPHKNPFQVRLVDGSHDAEGRVEVLYDGFWGTVCDDLWDLRDARVVCRMLGFDGALEATGSARFGQGSGRILLKYVNCDGTEENLADCAYAGIKRYHCSHIRDAGAICYSGSMFPLHFNPHLPDS